MGAIRTAGSFAALIGALALSGCAALAPVANQPTTAQAPTGPTDADCLASRTSAAVQVPSNFVPVAAFSCQPVPTIEDDQGVWSAVKEQQLTGDFTSLLAALAEPDDVSFGALACDASFVANPGLWLENAEGALVEVTWPRDVCGKPKRATYDALAGLTVTQTTLHPIDLVQTRAVLDSGCPTGYAVPAEVFGGDTPVAADPEWLSSEPVDTLRLCAYESGPDGKPGAGRLVIGGPHPTGTLAHDEAVQLIEGIRSAVPAPECSEPISGFAVVFAGDASGEALFSVEFDGCGRLATPLGALFTAPADTLALLDQARR